MNQTNAFAIKDTSANPAPLGLFGFGMTTILLNLHNAGFFEMNSMIFAMGIFYGGLAQIVAGILESKKNNTFGMTAFISYGFFWLTLVGLLVLPKLGWVAPSSNNAMIAYLVMWGIFTAILLVGTFRISRALQFVFASLTLLFFLLALGDATGNAALKQFTGFEGIVCGASALYTGAAQVLNEVYGRTILPLGPVEQKMTKAELKKFSMLHEQ
ncbi:acetate uptake transporter [Paraflavisolibacter sp. H34]|uniref:acetate uptake transporter n=1 Tax=Huijunlia imazamoxiresistens TaxID=3127457 RepID=UPI0030196254